MQICSTEGSYETGLRCSKNVKKIYSLLDVTYMFYITIKRWHIIYRYPFINVTVGIHHIHVCLPKDVYKHFFKECLFELLIINKEGNEQMH